MSVVRYSKNGEARNIFEGNLKFITNMKLFIFIQSISQVSFAKESVDCFVLQELKRSAAIDDSQSPITGFESTFKELNNMPDARVTESEKLNSTLEDEDTLLGALAFNFSKCYSMKSNPDYIKRWLELSNSYGFDRAGYAMARMAILYGGSADDEQNAVELIESNYKKGVETESLLLVVAYMTGRGVARDPEIAMQHLNEGAKRGSTQAQYYLAHIYRYGLYGVDKSEEKFNYWVEFQPKYVDISYECSISHFVSYGALEKGEVEEKLIDRCSANDE